jgi:hypothetical protein
VTLADPVTLLLLVATVYVTILAAKSATAGLVLALGAWALAASTSSPFVPIESSVSGIAVNALDVVSVAFLIVALVRLLQGELSEMVAVAILALIALIAVHIVRGALTDISLAAAINSSRQWIYLAAGLAYAATSRGLSQRAVTRVFVGFALALSVFATVRLLVGPGLPSAANEVKVDGVAVAEERPINAAAASLVLVALIILIGTRRAGRGLGVLAALLLAAMILLLQHRTVWAAAVGACLVGYFAWARSALPRSERAVLASSGGLVLLIPLVAAGFAASGVLRESLLSAWGLRSTFQWRTTTWRTLLEQHHSPSDLLLGRPAGSVFEHEVVGVTANVSPHSLYVDGLLRFGALAVVILVALGVIVLRRRDVAARALGFSPAAVVALLVALALFGIAYSFNIVHGLLLGILVGAAVRGLAADRARERRPLQTRPAMAAARPTPTVGEVWWSSPRS